MESLSEESQEYIQAAEEWKSYVEWRIRDQRYITTEEWNRLRNIANRWDAFPSGGAKLLSKGLGLPMLQMH